MSTSFTVDSDSDNVDYLQGMSLGVQVFTLLPTMWHSWLEFAYAKDSQWSAHAARTKRERPMRVW